MEKSRRKIRPIARKRRNYLFPLLGILFAIVAIYIFFSFAPESKLAIANFGIPILPIFLVSLTLFIYSLFRFIFINKTQALLFSVLLLFYLILRLIGLTHWIFAALFLALFVTIEIFLYRKK